MISKNTEVTKLEALIAAFDNDRNYFGTTKYSEKERMDKRSEFISDFPPEKLSNLQLNRYVVGKINITNGEADKTTFCYRLEFGIPGFGNIGGTPSSKYGIYCDKKTQEYKYDNQRYESPEEAFREIRIELDTIIKAGKQLIVDQDWKKLANVMERKYNIMRHVRSKILAVYFPDYFLSIHANKQAKEILESVFEVPPSEIDESLFLKQAMLFKFKNSHPSMKKWSIFDFSRFIWLANADRKTNINNTQKNNISLWVVRAGGNGEGENAALNHHVVTIGFGNLEGLAEIKDREQFDQKYAELHPNDNENSNAQRRAQVWVIHK